MFTFLALVFVVIAGGVIFVAGCYTTNKFCDSADRIIQIASRR